MLLFYFLLPILAVASQNSWKCNPKDTVIHQFNGTLSFPLSDQTLPYSKNMNCTWTIRNIPKNYVVGIDITANFAASDRFSIVSSTGYRHDFNGPTNDIPQLFTGSLYFPEGELEIVLISGNSNSDGFLAFTLKKQESDLNSYNKIYDITASQDFIQKLYVIFYGTVYGFTSNFKYVIRLVAEWDSINYASCLIYGVQFNEITFLTGLDTQIDGVPRQFYGTVLIKCFYDTYVSRSVNILGARLPRSISPQSRWIVRPNENFNYTLTSNNNYPTYLTTANNNNNLNDILYTAKSMNYNQNTTLELYCGSLTPVVVGEPRSMQFLEEIPLAESDQYLPQRLCSDWNTYAVTNGSVWLDFKNDAYLYNEPEVKPGRKGFVVTKYFGFRKSSSGTVQTFYGYSTILKFSYTKGIRNMDMDSALVSVRNNDQLISNDTLFGSFYTGQKYTAIGNSMEIQTIYPYTDSYGAFIFFEVTKTSSQGCLLIAICMSWAFAM